MFKIRELPKLEKTEKMAIDIDETSIYEKDPELLSILLKDQTTKKNIIWGTDEYRKYGMKYEKNAQILSDYIIDSKEGIIKPRSEKNKIYQHRRIKNKAEVFTPSWVCNKQNNLIDLAWFEYTNVFNTEIKNGWETIKKKIEFKDPKKTWKEYVILNRMEISCGEAPYITSRYDSVTGKYISVQDRIGLLDRKLRIISENISERDNWKKWALKALKSIYAYDYQGDNIILARENIMYTIQEHYYENFCEDLNKEILQKIAKIISWNIWQMDGIKYVVPGSCKKNKKIEYSLFGEKVMEESCRGCENDNKYSHNGIYCNIKDWNKNKIIRFIDLLGE